MRMIVSLLIFLLSLGCTRSSPPSSQRYLSIAFKQEVRSLDPRFGIEYPSAHVIHMLFEGLMRYNLKSEVEPAIARSYEVSADQKTYTFHLRRCFWSNGDLITAHDFEYSWKYVVDPKSCTTGSHNFYCIKNAQAIIKGALPSDQLGVRALDAQTLRVELEHPTPYFLEVLITPSFLPVNSKVDRENPQWTLQEKDFVSNGPFLLEKNQVAHEIYVKKNPSYWDAKSIRLPGIKIGIIPDQITQLHLFDKGELDWIGRPLARIALDALENLKKQGRVSFKPHLGIYWLFLNTQSYPLNNKKMRLALAYAINRRLIVDHVLQEQEVPAMSLLPFSIALQDAPYFPDHNVEWAQKLFGEALDELGLSRDNLPELSFTISNDPIHIRVAQAIQEQWHQNLGITVHLTHPDWKTHFTNVQAHDYQIGGMNWLSWIRDPLYILNTFRYRSDGINMSQWEDPKYQTLLANAEEELDRNKRLAYLHEAETMIMEEMPVIPLYFTAMAYMKNQQLKDFHLSDVSDIDFRWVTLEENRAKTASKSRF
jgi:oligopeptide transport system substrate-binding protein